MTLFSRRSLRSQNGNVLFMAIGVVFLLSAFGVVIVRSLGRHSRASGSQDEMQEIEMMRKVVLENTDCNQTIRPPLNAQATCENRNYILVDRRGKPIYQKNDQNGQTLFWKNPAGTVMPTWEIRTTCKNGALQVERKQFRASGGQSFLSNFAPLWHSEINPKLCASYFSPQKECSGKYPVATGGSDNNVTCCRAVDVFGLGGAVAACDATEYLHIGGAWCGPLGQPQKANLVKARKDVKRCILDTRALETQHIGQGSARGVTLTIPSLPALHTDPSLPAVMDARVTFPRTKSMLTEKDHGGFLLQSGYASMGNSATIDAWTASCKFDDWQGAYATTARAYCCAKKPKGFQ